ncbi:hypothetical protein [Paenibacillus macerans]|uniref:hypothetical protein n=1 Tax=Paenibacillus macerans TaxID=44252 RepID=UPI00203D0A9E|nr:hypothetical protein [Paenibacillus macerans]MCM3701731.1 hypothetical protein [Paenibacillus macerans]
MGSTAKMLFIFRVSTKIACTFAFRGLLLSAVLRCMTAIGHSLYRNVAGLCLHHFQLSDDFLLPLLVAELNGKIQQIEVIVGAQRRFSPNG